jgi:protein PhnA
VQADRDGRAGPSTAESFARRAFAAARAAFAPGLLNPSRKLPVSALPPCPKCKSEFTYEDGGNYVCPECAHEWSTAEAAVESDEVRVVKDAVGNVLQDGDSVTVIKDLKVKGSSTVVKVETKVRNIRLVDGDHDIDCKIEGVGQMGLKSEFVKKA